MIAHKYTDEEKAFMTRIVPGHSYAEIQKIFTDRFGWEISTGQIKAYIERYHLNTGKTGRFETGHIPSNTGKKMLAEVYKKAEPTMFKKGHLPSTYRPVGSERINKYGYIEIKIQDPATWKLKHRLVWENMHGTIPKDSIVIFKDGNRQNVTIDNLILIKKSINAVLNNSGLAACSGEFKEAAIKLAELKMATFRAKRNLDGFSVDKIGKTVFLTKSEAEAKLKELRCNND